LKVSIEESLKNLKCGEGLGGVVGKLSLELAREFCRRILELVDGHFLKVRDKELKVEHIRPRWISLPVGDIRIKRRQYRDPDGNIRYLLDECLGLTGKSPLTPELKEAAAYIATLLPFLKSAQVMQAMMPQASVSHTTLQRMVKKIAEPVLRAEKAKRENLYQTGEIPQGENRVVPSLLVEADGVNIALQREETSKAEIKVGIAYEGWKEISSGRYQLQGKESYCDMTGGDSFWEGFSLKLAAKYDLTKIGSIVVGGDGAGWVKSGADLMGGQFQLDRFHLLRALRRGLSHEAELIYPVYQACNEGNWPAARTLLIQARSRNRGKEKENIEQVLRYLGDNAAGLKDYRLNLGEEGKRLRRTGAIESNVDKLVANRMKKRGMSWTIKGARFMTRLLLISAEGKLSHACRPNLSSNKKIPPLKKMRRILVKSFKDIEEKWLQATLPAIYGPHCNRPWVTLLKKLSEASFNA
jgi:hypothetical protein